MTETVLKEALEQFQASEDGSSLARQEAYDDIRFARLADQWPDEVKKLREAEGRPCLTINRMPAFIRQVVNEARQNKPGVIVRPVDSNADKDAAKVLQGLIRSIERRSNAEVAYDTAIDHAVTGGFGFWRVGIDYCDPESFDLECRIERIANPLMVHWDVSSTAFDASDWSYAFVSDWLTEDEFERRYKKAKPVNFDGGDPRGDATRWIEDDRVRIAEYWQRTEGKRKILLLSNGAVARADMIPDIARQQLVAGGIDPEGIDDDELMQGYLALNELEVRREREASFWSVKRRILSGVEVLEEDDWPGTMIPICPVWGEEVVLDGRRHFRSMIRDAKDPQRMFNFWRSATTELVALAPRAPFIGPKGFIPKGHEQKWMTANTRSHAYLEYEGPTPPQRQQFAGVPGGAIQEALNAADDMKSIVGIYDSALGQRSNETSGKAILARQRESDVSNFHFLDNLAHALAYCGRVLVEIIPSVYSPQEAVRILGDDDKDEVVRLTQMDGGAVNDDGTQKLYNLSVGKYDVSVSSGPSYATQREEAREFMLEIVRQVPGAAPFIGDILMEQFDFEGADRVSQRLKLMLPPQVAAAEGVGPQQMPGAPMVQPGMNPSGQPQGGTPGVTL